ncbi:DNA cytosine methyltransferase [Microbacterium testaceum]|uniref:DNA cytosine methyltransferase n=1 Tax=Microbacterium testaceum TaxID=2033 RepID=UPI001C3F61EF|nr:DNA (cytosine-5-)-methyltransferase [Microbacterium testaceum]
MSDTRAPEYTVVEVCAGAGGQSLGLHKAGFKHSLAVEIDPTAAATLTANLGASVVVGDVADPEVWDPRDHVGATLFAGGVPCPPFSIAGKQLGSSDERDLFAWAIEQVGTIQPRAVMLENVRGLSSPRFAGYRQHVIDRLDKYGYVGEWKLLHASDFGVPQLRPRFVLVAMRPEDQAYFRFPEPNEIARTTVGNAIHDLMAARGWSGADEWRDLANGVGPTLVGGSKKHGGADLGPTRAKQAWAKLHVDGRGIANAAPDADAPSPAEWHPRLTIEMAARVQGWKPEDNWFFSGRKTSQYRQIGNAFPPPVAEAVGARIIAALQNEGMPREDLGRVVDLHDPVYRALANASDALSMADLVRAHNDGSVGSVEKKITALSHDFHVEVFTDALGVTRYRLGGFRGFTGQDDHVRHDFLAQHRNRVS